MRSQPKTMAELLSAYLPTAHSLKPNSIDILTRAWKELTNRTEDVPIKDFTENNAHAFIGSLLSENYAANSVNIWLKAVRPVWRMAHNRDYVSQNPFADIKLLRVPKSDVHIFKPDEVEAILASCPDTRRRFIVSLGLSSLRIGECLNLQREDIDCEANVIKIRPHDDSPYGWAWTPKALDKGIVPLQAKVQTMLLCYILPSLPIDQPYVCLTTRRYMELLWRKRQGKLLERMRTCPETAYARWFGKVLNRAGILEGSFHDLRATCITKWLSEMPIQKIQVLARHASPDTTTRFYYAANRNQICDEAQRIATF